MRVCVCVRVINDFSSGSFSHCGSVYAWGDFWHGFVFTVTQTMECVYMKR